MKISLCSSCLKTASEDLTGFRVSVLETIANKENKFTLLNDSDGNIFDSYKEAIKYDSYGILDLWLESIAKYKKIKKVNIRHTYTDNIYINTMLNTHYNSSLLSTDESVPENYREIIRTYNIPVYDKDEAIALVNGNYRPPKIPLLEAIITQLTRLMGRKKLYKIEDFHTGELCTGLLTLGYTAFDTHMGVSATGKNEGELDLYVQTDDGRPLSVIEALKETSCGEQNTNISTHLNKLLNCYDCWGLSENYLITYYEGANLESFWEKYKTYIENIAEKDGFSDIIPQISFHDTGNDISKYADMKIGKGIHKRSGKDVTVHHIVCNMHIPA